MRLPRNAAPPPLTLAAALACLLAAASVASAQVAAAARQQPTALSPPAARGVELHRQGKFDEAAAALRSAVKADKNDAESWHLLGVVLNSAGKAKEARKAFGAAVKLRPDHADSHAGLAYTLLVGNKMKDAERSARRALELAPHGTAARYTLGVIRLRQGKAGEALAEVDELIGHSPEFAPAYRLKGQAHVNLYAEESAEALVASAGRKPPASAADPAARRARRNRHLEEAARSFERYLQLAPNRTESAALREQLGTLRVHASASANAADPPAYSTSEVTTKAVILSKPEPLYTERARAEGVEGTVVLRMVLAADGQVRHVLVVQALSHGLTESALAAARKIQFNPATKDGRPVSQFTTIMYHFNIS
jgi:TonB family protein